MNLNAEQVAILCIPNAWPKCTYGYIYVYLSYIYILYTIYMYIYLYTYILYTSRHTCRFSR